MSESISYVVDLSSIDSVMGLELAHYYLKERLNYIVLHKKPSGAKQNKLYESIESLVSKSKLLGVSDVDIVDELPNQQSIVICCAPLSQIAIAVQSNKWITTLITSGGYVGTDYIANAPSDMDRRKPSPNLNTDFPATIIVLNSTRDDINTIKLVTENYTQHRDNTPLGYYWRYNEAAKQIFKKYNITKSIKLPYMLTCSEALYTAKVGQKISEVILRYDTAFLDFTVGMNDVRYWYSLNSAKTTFRKCIVSKGTWG